MSMLPPPSEPITVVVARNVRAGHEAEYESWFEGLSQTMAQFPGFLGIKLVRPMVGVQPEYVAIFSFANHTDLENWKQSPIRHAWLERALPFTEQDLRIQHISGMQGLFALPHTAVALAPPRWKMLIAVSIGLYPILLASNTYVAPLLADWPLPARLIPLTICNIALMTYAVMPMLTWLLRDWLAAAPAETVVAASHDKPG